MIVFFNVIVNFLLNFINRVNFSRNPNQNFRLFVNINQLTSLVNLF